jgi:RNA polymerase sigma factor (sigma-70 family)
MRRHYFGKSSLIASSDGIKPSDAATLTSDSVPGAQYEPVQISDHTFDDWVRQYQRLLFGIAYWWTGSRTDAEELTQEAFFQTYRSRSSLREIEAVKGWLVAILRHCYAQMYRKGHSLIEIPLDEVMEKSGETIDLRSDGADPHDFLALRQALERLDERHRLPLTASGEHVRRAFQGYPQSPFLASRNLSGLAHQRAQAASSTRLEIVAARAGLCGFADCALCVGCTLVATNKAEQRNGASPE